MGDFNIMMLNAIGLFLMNPLKIGGATQLERERWRRGLRGSVIGEEMSQMYREALILEEVDDVFMFQKSPNTLSHPPSPPRKSQNLFSQGLVTAASSHTFAMWPPLFLKIEILTEWLDPFYLVLSFMKSNQP